MLGTRNGKSEHKEQGHLETDALKLPGHESIKEIHHELPSFIYWWEIRTALKPDIEFTHLTANKPAEPFNSYFPSGSHLLTMSI